MVYSSKNLQDADTLAEKYQSSFGGKYSPEKKTPSGDITSFNFKGLWDLIVLSRMRLGILLGLCFIISMIMLTKYKPTFVIKRRTIMDNPESIDTLELVNYSFIFGFVFSVIFVGLSYKFPFIKNILFKEEDCDVCRA